MKKHLTILFLTCARMLLTATLLQAANVTVTNTNDDGSGSLRQAILDANPSDTIAFDIPTSDPGYYGPTGVYTIGLTSELVILKNLVISGVGSHVVVSNNSGGGGANFFISSSAIATIDSLTITNGSADFGGGIFNNGSLILNNCTLTGNQASGGGGGGGGLFNAATATVRNCTFTANEGDVGGAVLNVGTLILSDSTLSGNDASVTAGGIYSSGAASTQVRNTILAGNTGVTEPDVYGPFISDDYNFVGAFDGSSGFGEPHDQVGTLANPVDPKLGALADHAGYTATMAPLPGSLVIDQGKSSDGVTSDQRFFSRPSDQPGVADAADGDGSDIGAVELSEFQSGPNYTVTTAEDHDYGVCGTDSGCTLREALNAANADADANTVSFAPELTGLTITNTLSSTGLSINQPVTINGPGARLLTISGDDTNRCLQVTGGTVVINGLTFAHGASKSGVPGGGIQNANGATLTLNDCAFSENSVTDFGVGTEYGGGVAQLNAGILNVDRCTFADNTAGSGGALGNFDGVVVVANSTFTGNSAPRGGAIASTSFAEPAASLDLRSSTVVGNEATGAGIGGGLAQVGSTVTVTNSIIAANTSEGSAPNVSGTFVSEGSNVIGDAAGATGFTDGANGDQVGVFDPKVGVLGNHGGLTDTLSLLAGSAAINKANATTAPERDQRGYVRPDAPDVGAFEFGGTIPVTLANISTRLSVETGDNVLIGGFIVTGTEPKKILVRALGPSLPVAGKLANPSLELYDAAGLLLSNDNWKDTQQAEIQATAIPPPNDLESAIVATLPANAAYTAIVRGVNNTTGVGLVEVYDLDLGVDSKLANVSTRGLVQTGDDVIIGGLIVLGVDPQEVIVRAIGPSLPLAGKLSDPILELHDGNGALVQGNDNWRSDQEEEILSTLPPTNDLESAIVRTLAPGLYTAIVRGVGNTTGIALVEVYGLN